MIYSKKGYYTLTHIHFKETVLFEMLPLDFRISFRLVLAFRLDQSMIKKESIGVVDNLIAVVLYFIAINVHIC